MWPCLYTKNVKPITILNSPRRVLWIGTSVSNSTGGDARVAYDYVKKSPNEARRNTGFFSFTISSRQVSTLTNPCLVVTGCCSFKSVSLNTLMRTWLGPQSTPTPSRSSAQTQVPQLLQGSLLPNFHKKVQCQILIIVVQQLEGVSSIARTNLRAWVCGQTV